MEEHLKAARLAWLSSVRNGIVSELQFRHTFGSSSQKTALLKAFFMLLEEITRSRGSMFSNKIYIFIAYKGFDISTESSLLESISSGAVQAVSVIFAIIVNLIVFLAMVTFFDNAIGFMTSAVGFHDVTFNVCFPEEKKTTKMQFLGF